MLQNENWKTKILYKYYRKLIQIISAFAVFSRLKNSERNVEIEFIWKSKGQSMLYDCKLPVIK